MSSNTLEVDAEPVRLSDVVDQLDVTAYQVNLDTGNGCVPVGIHVAAPDRECAWNKLLVAVDRLGAPRSVLKDLDLEEL
ncbi:hypothetical protein [Halorubellus litoreus]|uniref:Uncharacterized protein n=1 Tax=Halorubellus litoreus TaxID=755308 RepID=A0ABD5VI02_9EURY